MGVLVLAMMLWSFKVFALLRGSCARASPLRTFPALLGPGETDAGVNISAPLSGSCACASLLGPGLTLVCTGELEVGVAISALLLGAPGPAMSLASSAAHFAADEKGDTRDAISAAPCRREAGPWLVRLTRPIMRTQETDATSSQAPPSQPNSRHRRSVTGSCDGTFPDSDGEACASRTRLML